MIRSEYFDRTAELISETPDVWKRYLYSQVDWNQRCIGIFGFRGTGKTTLLLQFAKETGFPSEECLYISCDSPLVLQDGIYEIGSDFFKLGGKCLILDEAHRYPQWGNHVKALYDSFPKKQIILSGSSTLDISNATADLSRRVLMYELRTLSFREFLNIRYRLDLPSFSLQQVFKSKFKIKLDRSIEVLKEFEDYLHWGSLPISFSEASTESYLQKLDQLLDKVLYEDIFSSLSHSASSPIVMKKIIALIATSPSFILNTEKLASELKIHRTTLLNYIDTLERGGIIYTLYPKADGYSMIRKHLKIGLKFPNLYWMIYRSYSREDRLRGNIRESFFLSQFPKEIQIFHQNKSDYFFKMEDKDFNIEIGGPNKSGEQVKDLENAYVVKDLITTRVFNQIPLFFFGFLY